MLMVGLCHSNERFTISSCSAGMGTTGILIAIDMALEQATRENVVDIPAIVATVRGQHMHEDGPELIKRNVPLN